MSVVRLDPYIIFQKGSLEWEEATKVSTWYVTDAAADENTNFETLEVVPHEDQPGLCIAFNVGKKRIVSITITLDGLIRAAADVLEARSKDTWSTKIAD